jgi:predicted secreted Zn-dependent protease
VKTGFRFLLPAALFALLPIRASAEWKSVEQVQTYIVAGNTGAELYASIGERGPDVGKGRAIAHTTFKLTWSRQYEPRGNACVLASARPKLILTYTLPKPAARLPASAQSSWETFLDGVHQHELVHGQMIKDMVMAIEAASVGMTTNDDPHCRKIRVDLTKRLGELSAKQRQRSRDFDQAELSEGGNIHRLVLGLVNGP